MTRKEQIAWLEMYSWHNLHEITLASVIELVAAATINQSGIAAAPDLLAENRRLREALESLESGVLTALAHTGVSDNDPHFRLTEADKILRQALLYVRRLKEQK